MAIEIYRTTRPDGYFTDLVKADNRCDLKQIFNMCLQGGPMNGEELVLGLISHHGWWVAACIDEDPNQPIDLDLELYWTDGTNACLKSNFVVLLEELKTKYKMPYDGDCNPKSPYDLGAIIDTMPPMWTIEMQIKDMDHEQFPPPPPDNIEFDLDEEELNNARQYLLDLIDSLPPPNKTNYHTSLGYLKVKQFDD